MEEFKELSLHGTTMRLYTDGKIERWAYDNRWKEVILPTKIPQDRNGQTLTLGTSENPKLFYRARLIAHAYLEDFNINNSQQLVTFADENRLNCSVDNLIVCDRTFIQRHRRPNSKGYYLNKDSGKYHAQIKVDNKTISLGQYKEEEDARIAYLDAKEFFH